MLDFFKKCFCLVKASAHAVIILYISLLSLLSLDAFDSNLKLWQQILGFLIHLTPGLLVLTAYLTTFKSKKTGGLLLIILGLISILFFHTYGDLLSFLIISSPLFIGGGLFFWLAKETSLVK